MRINRNISIDERWLKEQFVRASGPGGQNVNRVATAVKLRFELEACTDLSAEVKERLYHIAAGRVSSAGVLVIDARRFRTQQANRRDARRRLHELVLQALVRPEHRHPTRPSPSADRRRLAEKRKRKEIKQSRRRVASPDGE